MSESRQESGQIFLAQLIAVGALTVLLAGAASAALSYYKIGRMDELRTYAQGLALQGMADQVSAIQKSLGLSNPDITTSASGPTVQWQLESSWAYCTMGGAPCVRIVSCAETTSWPASTTNPPGYAIEEVFSSGNGGKVISGLQSYQDYVTPIPASDWTGSGWCATGGSGTAP